MIRRMETDRCQQQHRPALQPRQPCDDRAAVIRRHLEERTFVDHRVDNRTHLVDLAAVARTALISDSSARSGSSSQRAVGGSS